MPDWPHSPAHRFEPGGTYFVTGATYQKMPLFRGPERLRYLCETFLRLAKRNAWQLQAWAIFPNHYHFVGLSPLAEPGTRKRDPAFDSGSKLPSEKADRDAQKGSLAEFIRQFHSLSAIQVNRWDRRPGRQAWFQYWDTSLTFQRSYLARLSYVHWNAVHHGLTREPSHYPWCSAGWFQQRAPAALYKTVMGIRVDRVRVDDDFRVAQSDI